MPIDVYKHNLNQLSIKDLGHELNIGESKWDELFKFILEKTSVIYFRGKRLDYCDNYMFDVIDSLSEERIYSDDNYFTLVFKVKLANVSLGRGLMNHLWNYYEYPSLIFLRKEISDNEFNKLCKVNFFNDIFSILESMYILYRNIEPDVLWIDKTIDMEFPRILK